MATSKGGGRPQGKGGMDWSGSVRSGVVSGASAKTANDEHIPWSLIIAVVGLCVVLVVGVLLLGPVYVDVHNATLRANAATERAVEEINKMRKLRGELLDERGRQ